MDVKYLGLSVFLVAAVLSVIYLDVKYLGVCIFLVGPVIFRNIFRCQIFRSVNIFT